MTNSAAIRVPGTFYVFSHGSYWHNNLNCNAAGLALTLRYNCGSISNPMKQIELISFDGEGTLRTFGFGQIVWHEDIPALHAQKKGSDLTQVKKAVAIEPYFAHIFSSTFHYKQLETPILTLGCA